MLKNELLNQILDAYCAAVPVSAEHKLVCEQFCAFATDWLAETGVVGVGQTVEGVALRFKDGQERVLFTATSAGAIDAGAAVSITGNAGGSVRSAAPSADSSVKITG